MWDIVAAVVGALLFLGLGYLYYSGLFRPIVIDIKKPYEGVLPIAYKYMVGNYKDCGPAFGEFASATSQQTTLIGVYYDNPDEVDKNSCRFIVGAVLTGEAEQYRDRLMSRGYSFTTIPALGKAIVSDFPMVNYLSILIGVHRVYSTMFKYMKKQQLKNQGCMIELYGDKNMRVIAPLEENNEYFVKEFR